MPEPLWGWGSCRKPGGILSWNGLLLVSEVRGPIAHRARQRQVQIEFDYAWSDYRPAVERAAAMRFMYLRSLMLAWLREANMRSLAAHCHLGLGRLRQRAGVQRRAEDPIAAAAR